MVNVGLYAFVFFGARLYADAFLQVVYFVLSAYGWWAWLHGGAGGSALPVARAPRRLLAALLGGGVVVAVLVGTGLHRMTDAALPYLDAGTMTFSLIAQFLMTRKWIENWVLWIAVDVVYVHMYVVKDLYATALLYAVFLVLAASGLVQWSRSIGRPLAEAEPA